MMDSYERVHEYLEKLGLTVIEGTIDSYLETAHGKPVMGLTGYFHHSLHLKVKAPNYILVLIFR